MTVILSIDVVKLQYLLKYYSYTHIMLVALCGFFACNLLFMSIIKECPINVSLFSVIIFQYLEWTIHKISHNKQYGGALFATHQRHHKLYSGTHLVMDAPYQGSNGDIIFIPWVASIWLSVYMSFSLYFTLIFIIQSSFLMWLSNYIHEQIHIKNSWLETNKLTSLWFSFTKRKHFIHHSHPQSNMSLGGLSFLADYTLGTYR